MKKNLITIALLALFPSSASADADELKKAECAFEAKLAHLVMKMRQDGIPLEKPLQLLPSLEAFTPHGQAIIHAAYDTPVYESLDSRTLAIGGYASKVELNCYKR